MHGTARTLQQLLGDAQQLGHIELHAAVQQSAQVMVHVLKNQIYAAPHAARIVTCVCDQGRAK